MRINFDYEPEIILKDLAFAILYRWRSILATALIGVLLLSGFQFVKYNVEQKQVKAAAAQDAAAAAAADAAEKAAAEAAAEAEAAEAAAAGKEAAEADREAAEAAKAKAEAAAVAAAEAQEARVAQQSVYNQELADYNQKLIEYNANVAMYQSRLDNYHNLIADLEDYMANSVYYNLDISSFHSVVRTYLVKLTQEQDPVMAALTHDPANDLLVFYSYFLRDKLDPKEMEAMLGTGEEKYINELIDVKTSSSGNTLDLIVRGGSEEMVATALEYFDRRLMEACEDQTQAIYPNELIPLGDRKDLNDQVTQLLDNQQKQVSNLIKYQNSIADTEKSISKLEVPVMPEIAFGDGTGIGSVVDSMSESSAESDPESESETVADSTTESTAESKARIASRKRKAQQQMIKAGLMGFVLFMLLAVIYHGVKYLMGERLHDSTEMTRRYGLLVYEDAPHSRARRPGKGIDRLIERWEFGKQSREARGIGRQAAGLLCKSVPDGSTLVLVSTRSEQALRQLRETLAEALVPQNTQVLCTGDCHKEDRLTQIPAGATLVIVEEKYQSRIVEVNREAELVSLLGMKTTGAILL